MNIHKASEDYLEAMLMLQERRGYIRSIDVAQLLGVSKPSVSYATRRLREAGYLTMDEENRITLTGSGMEIAQRMYQRHRLLTDFFLLLGVDKEAARTDACKVEHDLSQQTFAAICAHVKEMKQERSGANDTEGA